MKPLTLLRRLTACTLLVAAAPAVVAYPPAPDHVLHGLVRTELGQPVSVEAARLELITEAGRVFTSPIAPQADAGINYVLAIPMDSALGPDVVPLTALRPLLPFTLRVIIRGVTYLPIEMSGEAPRLGRPGEVTRLDLTLGEDADGDGIPDAWERAQLARLGAAGSIADIRPGDDLDRDGLSNLQEYLAGTYAHEGEQDFTLRAARGADGVPRLQFLVVPGRSYVVETAGELQDWVPVGFSPGDAEPVTAMYEARDVRVLTVRVPQDPTAAGTRFFRLRVR